jgi:hypothetical protein
MKQFIILIVLSLAVLGLFGYESHKYAATHNKPPVATVPLSTLEAHDSQAAATSATDQKLIQHLVEQRTQLCDNYKTAKVVVDPSLCR